MQKLNEFGATYQVGIVSAIDDSKHNVRVRFPALDNLESDWLGVITPAAGGNQFYTLPDLGAMVACLLDARGEGGCVIGCLYNAADTTPAADRNIWIKQFSNGTVISHDRQSGHIQIQTTGIVSIQAPTSVFDGDVVIQGSALVQKQFTYQGGMSGSGGNGASATITGTVKVQQGDIMADNISLKNHTHPDLTSGGHTGSAQ